MIFVGEHTSYTHAWIASALESGIRGGVQLLLGECSFIIRQMLLADSFQNLGSSMRRKQQSRSGWQDGLMS